jgi:glutamate/aspartate transport system substrate-binding protein
MREGDLVRKAHGGRLVRVTPVMLAVIALCAAPQAFAQRSSTPFVVPYTGTLKKINEGGVLRIGYRESSPPFAFLDSNKRPIGYALDLCDVVVQEVSGELAKDVGVEYRAVTPENRFDLLKAGAIDLECGSSTNTAERRGFVAFSPTMFVTGTKLLVRRGSGIRSLSDLQGRTVVLTRGTVQAETIPRLAARQKLAIKFVTAGDHRESFQTLASRKADAFANDDVQLYGMTAETRSSGEYQVVGDFLTYADYALALRKDDPEFAAVVERAFSRLAGSREFLAIYEKWFMRPLPSGVRLNLPMSPHLEQAFRVKSQSD